MQINMGNLDRVLRVIVAISLALLFYTGTVVGTAGVVGLVVAAVFLSTAAIGNCPLYTMLGLRTCSRKS